MSTPLHQRERRILLIFTGAQQGYFSAPYDSVSIDALRATIGDCARYTDAAGEQVGLVVAAVALYNRLVLPVDSPASLVSSNQLAHTRWNGEMFLEGHAIGMLLLDGRALIPDSEHALWRDEHDILRESYSCTGVYYDAILLEDGV